MGGRVAMSADGHVVATATGRQVWVARHEGSWDPVDVLTVDDEVIAVAAAPGGFVALTAGGAYVGFGADARMTWCTDPASPGVAIAGDSAGAVALTRAGWQRLTELGPMPVRPFDGGTAIAWAPDGTIAVGGADGRVRVFGPDDAARGVCDLDEAGGVRDVTCADAPGGRLWIATAGERVYRVTADGRGGDVVTRVTGMAPDHVAATRDGRVIAVRARPDLVFALVLATKDTAAQIRYPERTVVGVALGGPLWLGIGLDQGDNNWVSLRDGSVWRSDPPKSEPRRSWMVAATVTPEVLGHKAADPALGAGGGAAATGLSEDPADGSNRPATEEAPKPSPQATTAQVSPEGWFARWTGWLSGR